VARRYGATLEIEGYFNASLPVESFPFRHEIAARWAERSDPAARVAETIRRFRPDVVLTFPPVYGATGHPEHQLASRFATAGVRLAADEAAEIEGEPFRVPHTYYMLSRYRFLKLARMQIDPLEPTETFDARQPCVEGRSCVATMAELTRPHRTQDRDMRAVRLLAKIIRTGYLRRTDPFTEIHDPYEEHPVRGMG
jgi:LmbE family N-acetylglucosaminyl deacetylase